MRQRANHRCNLVRSHLENPPREMTTLCFLDAFHAHKSGQITWDEYLRHLLIHLTGVKHKEDERKGMYPELRVADPFGYGLFCLNQDLERKITDIGPFEAVFQAYRRGSLSETREGLAALRGLDEKHIKWMRVCVAFLALQEREAKALEMCLNLDGGFPYEAYFVEEADRVDESRDPETFRVIEQSDLRQYFPRRPPRSDNDEDPAATFDRGGKLPVDW